NTGVLITDTGTVVSTASGDLIITGIGQGSGNGNTGISVVGGATLRAGGAGKVRLVGDAPGDTGAINLVSGATLQSGSGDVTLEGDVINLTDANSLTSTGGSTLIFEPLLTPPFTTLRPIVLGGTTNRTNALTFTSTDAAAIQQGAGGFANITIGTPDGIG